MQCYCKGGCYTQGLEKELDAEHIYTKGKRMFWIVVAIGGINGHGIKFIDHVMKELEKLVEKEVKSTFDSMQFGFNSRKGITDAIFIVRQMQEKPGKEERAMDGPCRSGEGI